MRLSDLCLIRVDLQGADVYLSRTGSTRQDVGKVSTDYAADKIGIKVVRTDLLVPRYLYYLLQYLQGEGVFASLAEPAGRNRYTLSVEMVSALRFADPA